MYRNKKVKENKNKNLILHLVKQKINKTVLTVNQKHIQTSVRFRSLLMLDPGKKVIFK